MDNRYTTVATAVTQAEKALKTLVEFHEAQRESKGDNMEAEIIEYIVNTLSCANYLCCGCKYKHLALSRMKSDFIFYIYDDSAISSGYPVFRVTDNGKVKHICKLSEWMMLALVNDWQDFKEELDHAIKITLKNRTNNITNQLSHIGYVNEQLKGWRV